ncbi:MAG: alpha/beta hydrolase [Alicyclobacillus herbarius]|uniref:alpha/beta fold hydrolase n=1 Tax=Alicyclobacillus herbarius TaxID=122960 RepID=UPI0023537B6C|nr:alpha/beta hydrolase [Alicyclobacillus herbarius]MCL6632563.1 alpha/beta hydrolase [Alicyclobacillus herbarius]
MYCEVQGERIFYDRTGDKSGPYKLLFVHGASSYASFWLPVMARLAQMGDVEGILLDLPGHYRSSGEARTRVGDYASFIRDFVQVITRLHPDLGQRFIYVGHSMGGAIGQELAIDRPDWLDGLVLLNTAAKLSVPNTFLQRLAHGDYDAEYFLGRGFAAGAPERLRKSLFKNQAVSVEASYHDFLAAAQFDRTKDVHHIDTRTLILCGAEDHIVDPAGPMFLHQEIADSVLMTIPGSGHFLPLEDPRMVARAVHDFAVSGIVESEQLLRIQ